MLRSTSVGLALLAVLSISLASTPADAANPCFQSDYRGEDNRPLARCSLGEIGERDFFLFLCMMDDAMPDIVYRFESEPLPARREELREHLHRGLENYVATVASRDLPLKQTYPRINLKATELLLLPVYDVVWTERVARQEMQVSIADCRKFYDDNPEAFARRSTAATRVIFLNLSPEAESDVAIAAEEKLATIRERAINGEDFAELAKEFSQAPSAREGGLMPAFSEGELFMEYEDIVDELEPGEISEPFPGAAGVYLVKLERRDPAQLPEFEIIEDQVRAILERQVLRFQYFFMLGELMESRKASLRTIAWELGRDSEWLYRVGRSRLTVGDFVRLFPEVVTGDCFTDTALLEGVTQQLFEGELIRNDLLRRDSVAGSMYSDSLIERARDLAPSMLRTRRLLAERMFEAEEPTTDALRMFYFSNIDQFQELETRTMLKVSASLRDPESMNALEQIQAISDARDEMRTILAVAMEEQERIDKAALADLEKKKEEYGEDFDEEDLADEDADTTPSALLKIQAFSEAMALLDSETYAIEVELVEVVGETPPEGLTYRDIDELKTYDVVGPSDVDDAAVYWVCLAVEPTSFETFEDAIWDVKGLYEALRAEQARDALVQDTMARVDVTWLYEELPYNPRARQMERAIKRRVVPRPETTGEPTVGF